MASKYETLSSNVLETSQTCKEHNKQFQKYCKTHDCPCCSKCIVSAHQTCQDLIQLEDMVQNVKKSYGFHDIQQTMIDMVENIQRIKKDRQANLSTLKEERKMVEKEIKQTRIKINAQLDKFQEDILKELCEVESKESKMIGELLDSIEKNEKEIRGYQENLVKIKQHSSNLQTFLAMKQMERDVAEKGEYFTSLVTSNKLNRVSLSCKMNDALQNIFKEIRKFGEVIISTRSCELEIVRTKEKQAQIVVAFASPWSIDNISFILQATIDTKLDDVRGCALLPDGRMVFSCHTKNCVRGFNRDGSQDFEISLIPGFAFDITYITDNTIAVTSGVSILNQDIRIIDVVSKKVKETIPVKSCNSGIVSRNNTLIYCAGDCGIRMINLTDKSVTNIITCEMHSDAYVATFGDKLYFTNWNTQTVICCDLHGIIQWEFTDESVLEYPQDISVDNAGNVYVAGYYSYNVVVISREGKRYRQLLSIKDGLMFPQALHYDRSTNQLLVANQTGTAFLYKLE